MESPTSRANPRDYAYDLETYPNVILFYFIHIATGTEYLFEYSYRRNDVPALLTFLQYLHDNDCRGVGFNNEGFDYPIIHHLLCFPDSTVKDLYDKALAIIECDDRFYHTVREPYFKQIDLYKIHHFDNPAKLTSLKMLEFVMRSDTIQELPYKPGSLLLPGQIDELIKYNRKDVIETIEFYQHSQKEIAFREQLSERYDRDFMNHNDTRIGKDYFVMKLGRDACYDRNGPKQTHRGPIPVADIILPYVRFERPDFNRILDWLRGQHIVDTKNAFKDLHTVVDGFRFDFGTGGIHGSIESQAVHGDLIDVDVKSYYANLAIINRLYPYHLGERFCDIYDEIYKERIQYPSKTAENFMLKQALTGVYGNSNSTYSPFYDPLFTMSITINGQLLLCMLAEQLMKTSRLIQVNTDGVTVQTTADIKPVCEWWERLTGLTLEYALYSRMWIRDVNSYIAEYAESGELKKKGAYAHVLEWHKNHSALVVPKAAEAVLVRGVSIEHAVYGHPDLMDFMLRTNVRKPSRLELDGRQIQNISRYYIATRGGPLVKIMPPTPKQVRHYHEVFMIKLTSGELVDYAELDSKKHYSLVRKGWVTDAQRVINAPERRFSINAGRQVIECNDIKDFRPELIDYDWYCIEVDKLVRYAL